MTRPALTRAQARELVAWYEHGKHPRELTSRKLRHMGLIDPDGWQLNKQGRAQAEAERLATQNNTNSAAVHDAQYQGGETIP